MIVKIEVTIRDGDGKIYQGEVHPEEYFIVQLGRAIANDKNPIDALAFLADWGAKNLNGTTEEYSRLGFWPWQKEEKQQSQVNG